MVPKIAEGGENFVAAGNYYLGQGRAYFPIGYDGYMLHSKNSDDGTSRVAFALTLNLPTEDPDEGFSAMQASLERFRELRSGKRGRPLKVPVYSYSLSWAIGEQPDRDDMLKAVYETLDQLRLKGHQAVVVSHNDKAYEHVHVIANRIRPDLSGTVNMRGDQLTLSNWAEGYERRHGIIFCQQRVENNERRRRGEFAADVKSKSRVQIERLRRGFEPIYDAFYKRQKSIFLDVTGESRESFKVAREQLDMLFKEMRARLEHTIEAARVELNISWSRTLRQQGLETRGLSCCRKRKSLDEFVSSISERLVSNGIVFEVEKASSKTVIASALKNAHAEERSLLGKRDAVVCENTAETLWLEYWPSVEARMERIRSELHQRERKGSLARQKLDELAMRLELAGNTLAKQYARVRTYERRIAADERAAGVHIRMRSQLLFELKRARIARRCSARKWHLSSFGIEFAEIDRRRLDEFSVSELLELRRRVLDEAEKSLAQRWQQLIAISSQDQQAAFRRLVDAILAADTAFVRLEQQSEKHWERLRDEEENGIRGPFGRIGRQIASKIDKVNLDAAIRGYKMAVAKVQDALSQFVDLFKSAVSVAREYLAVFVGRRSSRWADYSSSDLSETAHGTDVMGIIRQKVHQAVKAGKGEGRGPEIVVQAPTTKSTGRIGLKFPKPGTQMVGSLTVEAVAQLPDELVEVEALRSELSTGIALSRQEEERHAIAREIEKAFYRATTDPRRVEIAATLTRFVHRLKREGALVGDYLSSSFMQKVEESGVQARNRQEEQYAQRRAQEWQKLFQKMRVLRELAANALQPVNSSGEKLSRNERLERIATFRSALNLADKRYQQSFQADYPDMITRIETVERAIERQLQCEKLEAECMILLQDLKQALLSSDDREIVAKASAFERKIVEAEKQGSDIRKRLTSEVEPLKMGIQNARSRIKQAESNTYRGPSMGF